MSSITMNQLLSLDQYLERMNTITTMQEAVEASSAFLGMPFIMNDASFHVLGIYPDAPVQEEEWDYMQLHREAREEDIDIAKYHSTLFVPTKEYPSQYFPVVDGFAKARFNVMLDEIVVGYAFSISPAREYSSEQKLKMAVIRGVLTNRWTYLECIQQGSYDDDSVSLKHLIEKPPAEALSIIRQNNPDSQLLRGDPFVLLYLPITWGDYTMTAYWRHMFLRHFPGTLFYPETEAFVMLINLSNLDFSEFVTRITSLLKRFHLRAFCSDEFHDIEKLKSELRAISFLAYQNIEFNSHLIMKRTHRYDILAGQIKANQALSDHPAVVKLLQHDTAHHTSYCKILYSYLLNFHNLTRSSEELFLHRTTLNYHLQRISELIQVDLENEKECFTLLVTLIKYGPYL